MKDSPYKGRHEKFQLGTNPMEMTAFEKSRAHFEREEREEARRKYIYGLQGRDGGHIEEMEDWDDSYTDHQY